MKGSTQQLRVVPATSEGHENKAEVAHILEEDEIKQIYRDRSAEDALDEAEKMKLQKKRKTMSRKRKTK